MMRDDPNTDRKVRELIAARAHEQYQQCNEMLRELYQSPDDAFLLMLILARHAAFLAHAAHHDFDADVRPKISDLTGAEQVAMQMIAMVANDQVASAADLAMATVHVGNVNPKHAQSVIVELVELAAHGGPQLVVTGVAGPAVGPDPRLN